MPNRARQPMRVGVIMPIAEDDATHTTPGYAEIRAIARQAEAAGFDSIWVYDHLLYRVPDQPTGGSGRPGRCWRRWPRPPSGSTSARS